MLKPILISLFVAMLSLVSFLSQTSNAASLTTPDQVVTEFQKLTHHELFCYDENWAGDDTLREGDKFRTYFSRELFKLFMWAQCFKPYVPPHYSELNNSLTYDIRFSIDGGNVNHSGNTIIANNIRISSAKKQGSNKAIVVVRFNYQEVKMSTNYTLILEDGLWKIDDIAPQADSVKNKDFEGWPSSDSIKAEMQKNYNAAMERYNQEQGKKGIAPKK